MSETLPDQNTQPGNEPAQPPNEQGHWVFVQDASGGSAQETVAVQSPAAAPPDVSTTDPPSTDKPKHEPGDPVGSDAPKLAELEGGLCGNCATGVMEVVRYDPDATYESGQEKALDPERRSGGAYEVRCRNCTYSESRAFNPGAAWSR